MRLSSVVESLNQLGVPKEDSEYIMFAMPCAGGGGRSQAGCGPECEIGRWDQALSKLWNRQQ